MNPRAFLMLLAPLLPLPAAAQVVSERAERVSVVVYPDFGYEGLAMVAERRPVDLPAGPSRVDLRNVAAGIVPQTVAIEGLPGGVKEQNFDYRLLSPGELIASSLGRTVRVSRTNPATGRIIDEPARIVASQTGAALDFGGRIEALGCSGLPEKLIFDTLPAGFSDRPTLSVDVVALVATRASLVVTYLATGVTWTADYVARIRPDGQTLDLSSWITISNESEAAFPDAVVQVVAGRLEVDEGETQSIPTYIRDFAPGCWKTGRDEIGNPNFEELVRNLSEIGFVQSQSARGDDDSYVDEIIVTSMRVENLGDYKLYSLPEPTTLDARQSKQLRLFERRAVPFQRVYRFDLRSVAGGDEQQAIIVAELKNEEARGLGLSLPAGRVAVFEGAGATILAGEARLKDTAVGLPVEVIVAESDDVSAVSEVVRERERGTRMRSTIETTIVNSRAVPVTVQLREHGHDSPVKVRRASARAHLKHGEPEWTLKLRPGETRTLTYTLDWFEED